jgi:hypothetical protein
VCHLSKSGVLDAVKHGWTVSADSTVEMIVSYRDEVWEPLFTLFPDPLPSEEGTVDAVELHVGRIRSTGIEPSEPYDLDGETQLFEYKIPVWPKPSLEVEFGAPRNLNRCAGIKEVLAVEAALVEEFRHELDQAESDLFDLQKEWREWVASEGVDSAAVILDWADGLRERAKTVNSARAAIAAGRSKSAIAGARDAAIRPSPDDDDLAHLMDTLCTEFEQLYETIETIEGAERRHIELSEAEGWVRAVGSPRLRKALQTGNLGNAMGAYRDERLAHDRPGWKWWDAKEVPVKTIVNPSESDLDELIVIQKLDPDAKLAFSPDLGSVITSTFLGRRIFKSMEPF